MNPVLQIAVIADDITGAADAAVQFCPVVGPVHMINAVGGELSATAIHTAGLAVFTNTRNIDAARASAIVRVAIENIHGLSPRLVYKKMDSCLRGNVGAEIDAMLQATGATATFVAPAFPQQRRTTVNDCHLIEGVPVADTEIGRDPLCPVRQSRLSGLLSTQSQMPVGHVDLTYLEGGSARLAERVLTLLGRGCRHIAFDAVQTAHLDAVARLAWEHVEPFLLVGSAGLAGSLARILGRDLPLPAAADRPNIKTWLFVCGSASRVLAAQVAKLARSTGWTHTALDPSALTAADGSTHRQARAAHLADKWSPGGMILSIRPVTDAAAIQDPDRMARGLAEVAAGLLATTAADGVFLSGGDTAEAFRHQIGASAVLIREEILPGLMRGEFVGGPHNGLVLVTKAGAFGHADTLNQLIKALN